MLFVNIACGKEWRARLRHQFEREGVVKLTKEKQSTEFEIGGLGAKNPQNILQVGPLPST